MDDILDGMDAGVGEISNIPEGGSVDLGESTTEVDHSGDDPQKYTEDEILDWAADQGEKEKQQQAKLADPNAKPDQQTPPQPGQTPQQPQVAAENEVKTALKSLATTHPAAARQIRDAYFAAQAYRDLMPIQDARTLRGMFTSVQEAKQAQTAAADLLALDFALVNDPSGLVKHISSRSPEAIQSLATSFGASLFDVSPDLYRTAMAEPAVKTFLEFMGQYASQIQSEEGRLAVDVIKELEKHYWAGEQGKTGGKYDKALQERLARADQIEESQRVERATGFQEAISSGYIDRVSESISRMIDNTDSSLSDAAKNQIVEKVASELGSILQGDQYLQRRLALEIRGGERQQGHRDQVVKYLFDRVSGLLGPMTRDAVEEMTRQVVPAGGVVNMPVPPQRPRTPIGAPVGSSRKMPGPPLTRQESRKMSEDDIIDHFLEA
jgi:hypothetical protein